MQKRIPVSKKVRFEVFKRDAFTCGYCGATPPGVVLELDHIQPVSKGGGNEIDNLITSCFDCNRGKSDQLLSSIPATLIEKTKIEKERELQLKEYKKLKTNIKRRQTKDIKKIESVFIEFFPEYSFTVKFKSNVKQQFLQELDAESLCENMEIACSKIDEPDDAIKYFCGINWNIIKGR